MAVLGTDFWSAQRGREALEKTITWDDSAAFKLGSAQILAQYRDLAQQPGAVAREEGDTERALQEAAQVLEAEFQVPFLAHAAMEPLDCVILPEAVAAALRAGATLAAPTYQGRRGHPVGFAHSWQAELLALTGDRGARHLLEAAGSALSLVPTDDPGVLLDIDRPADVDSGSA